MQNSKVKNIVIVGGGTAGWMTAASLAHNLKIDGLKISLIESEEIGTVGVGEATIPSIRSFNDSLGIDEVEFLQKTQASFKLGIEFRDWRELGSSFFHPFADYGIDLAGIPFHHHLNRLRSTGQNVDIADFSFPTQLAKQNRFAQPHPNPPSPLADYGYAYHFDAGRYALFLRNYAEQRGVVRIEGKIEHIEQNDNGDVATLTTESGQSVSGELFIDCSGFRGLLIEQTLATGYDDWRHWLPCDRAIAVQSEMGGEITPYTRTTAKDSGWQWRIPLQHRTGNGYVYASDFCTPDRAEKTLLDGLDGAPITEPRKFEFVTGKRKNIWNKNVFAIGLSGGFLEPLESTSISLIQTGISKLLNFFPYHGINEWDQAEVNRQHSHEFERIRDFLILHYKATKRDDSPFWRHCQSMEIPETLQLKMALFENRGHVMMLEPEAFERDSWVTMYCGYEKYAADYDRRADTISDNELNAQLEKMKQSIASAASQPLSHSEFIRRHCAAPKPD
ncbi:tryptophan 7-halogenase [Gilvimarinus sp. SDUM040013]|uniref:Tryptophan halogenase family protein n=1 Tax=Gilvimarinus gilvus TaxID=3058038 RepID=A0ABU4RWE9_9GAMM|nr:tryptophan halogenase family protein [Gilvimarinus sp. SDUM040013]MDO3385222.1 tryptophan 7-halogenase [Gilvimarinus sp. SDUM040013]MDX6849205.1 tryptophan halogenase family protein [Gilvimarinus sp. SDUM040013]